MLQHRAPAARAPAFSAAWDPRAYYRSVEWQTAACLRGGIGAGGDSRYRVNIRGWFWRGGRFSLSSARCVFSATTHLICVFVGVIGRVGSCVCACVVVWVDGLDLGGRGGRHLSLSFRACAMTDGAPPAAAPSPPSAATAPPLRLAPTATPHLPNKNTCILHSHTHRRRPTARATLHGWPSLFSGRRIHTQCVLRTKLRRVRLSLFPTSVVCRC